MKEQKTLLFASTNLHKFNEILPFIPAAYRLISLRDILWNEDIPEPYETFEENAIAKTTFLMERTGLACFSEDSGLVVDALGGRPGVYSARYSGIHGNGTENNNKVLSEMRDQHLRSARFVSVIAFQTSEKDCHLFKGIVEGIISDRALGDGGFGYDPIFIPCGFRHTFGELAPGIKQAISHRRRALHAFLADLKSIYLQD